MATTGVDSPGRASIGAKTLRTDRWWIQPAFTFVALTAFVVYSAWRVFSNQYYLYEPYVSLYYSPCLVTTCEPGALPGGPISWWTLSPALLIAWIPLTFRLTCYYYRKAYYRSFWLSPPACAVAEPHGKYTGETRLPLIIQNVHRYFFYAAPVLISLINTYDAIVAFHSPDGGFGTRARHRDPAGQRGAAVGLHAVVPLLPAHRRRPAQALLQAPGPLQDVDARSRKLNARHMQLRLDHAGHRWCSPTSTSCAGLGPARLRPAASPWLIDACTHSKGLS